MRFRAGRNDDTQTGRHVRGHMASHPATWTDQQVCSGDHRPPSTDSRCKHCTWVLWRPLCTQSCPLRSKPFPPFLCSCPTSPVATDYRNASDRPAHQQVLSLWLCFPLFITHHFIVYLRILSQKAPGLHHRTAADLPVSQLHRSEGMHADSSRAQDKKTPGGP